MNELVRRPESTPAVPDGMKTEKREINYPLSILTIAEMWLGVKINDDTKRRELTDKIGQIVREAAGQ